MKCATLLTLSLEDTFKRETLEADKGCIGERPKFQGCFTSAEELDNIEKSAARLAGNQDEYRALSCWTRNLKERYVRSLACRKC